MVFNLSMLQQVKIKLTSPLLGDQRTREGVRRFDKTDDDFLILSPAHWYWACKEAACSLHMDNMEPETIKAPDKILIPTLHLYNNRYRSESGRQLQEMFECIKAGTVITFYTLITGLELGQISSGKVPATQDDLLKILTLIGQHIGMSPWGNKFGFGRFNVVEIKEL